MSMKKVFCLFVVFVILFVFQASCTPEKLHQEVPVESPGASPAKPVKPVDGKPGATKTPTTGAQNPDIQTASMLISRGNLNEAEVLLKKNSEDFDNIYMLGILERERGNYDEALKYLDKALTMNPEHAKTLKYRGYVNFFAGKYPEAIADLEKLSKLRPEDPEAFYGMAMAYKEQGKTKEAEENALKGIDLEISVLKAKKPIQSWQLASDSNRISVLQRILGGKAGDKFIEIAKLEYEQKQNDTEALSRYAILLYDYGKTNESKKVIEQAVQNLPRQYKYEGHRLMGEFLTMERQHPQAEKEYAKAISMIPKMNDTQSNAALAELYNLYGDSFLEQAKYEQAEDMFRKSLEYSNKIIRKGDTNLGDDKLTEYYVNMARLCLKNNDPAKADEFIKKAEVLKSGDNKENQSGDVASIRAELYVYKKQYEEAIKVLQDMADKYPESLDQIYIRMAAAYSGMKDKKNALDCLKKALEYGNNKRRIEFFIKENPNFDFIRNDSEVKDLLK